MRNARSIARWCVALLVLSIASGAPTAAEEGASSSATRNVLLDVLLEERAATILFATDLQGERRVEGGHEPTITLKTWRAAPRDQSEIVVAIHDQDGRVLRAFAAPGKPLAFFETSAGGEGLHGGAVVPARDERLFRFEASAKARYLSIYRTQVLRHPADPALEKSFAARFHQFETKAIGTKRSAGQGGGAKAAREVTFGWTALGSFPIPGTPPWLDGEPSYPIPGQPMPELEVLDILNVTPNRNTPFPLPPDPEQFREMLFRVKGDMEMALREPYLSITCLFPEIAVANVVPLSTAAPPTSGDTRNCNIVIAGDGFDGGDADLAKFTMYADWALEVFQSVVPYSTHFANLNIWRVETTSNDSGIANCSGHQTCPEPRETPDTYYQVSGCAIVPADIPCTRATWPGFVGPRTMCPIEAILSQYFPFVSVDLVLLVANCSKRGGAAYPDRGLAVICTCEDYGAEAGTFFKRLVAHECGHVVGKVVDEYWGCARWEGQTFPNFATREQVDSNTMPWAADFPEAALARHVYNTVPCNGQDHNGTGVGGPTTNDLGPGLAMDTVGSFWGCGFADDASWAEGGCCGWNRDDGYTHRGGAAYFRPSPQCRMRTDDYASFCPVCEKAIGDALANPPATIW